jgi:hypothetical protein
MPEHLTPAEAALWLLASNAGGHVAFPSSGIQRALQPGAALAFHYDPRTKTYFVEAITASGRP